jgi:DNA-binding response OmpR family regulator
LQKFGFTDEQAQKAIAEIELPVFLSTRPSHKKPVQQTPIDLVISELVLPDENGYSLIRKLNALHVQIPAIALTVFASNDDRRQALAAGSCRHMPKPLDLNRLIETVASVTQPVQAEVVIPI